MGKILIVVDMQRDFITGALGTNEALRIVPRVINKIKNYEGSIIYTRDTHTNKYLETQEGKNLPVVHCVADSDGWQLEDEINRLAQDGQNKIFDKHSFGSMEMAEYLLDLYKSCKIDTIDIVGLCTDICVISNAIMLKTIIPEVKIVVDSSCCAGVTPKTHENALKAMKMCQIAIV